MIFPREKNHNHINEALTLYRLLKTSLYGAYGVVIEGSKKCAINTGAAINPFDSVRW